MKTKFLKWHDKMVLKTAERYIGAMGRFKEAENLIFDEKELVKIGFKSLGTILYSLVVTVLLWILKPFAILGFNKNDLDEYYEENISMYKELLYIQES